MNWSADTFSATIKNPLPLGMGSVNDILSKYSDSEGVKELVKNNLTE